MNGAAKMGILLAGIAKNVRRSIPHVTKECSFIWRDYFIATMMIIENDSLDGTKI
jgi:hypothetical protein